MTKATVLAMTAIVRVVCDELANEWGYLLYVALTVWFSVRFLRDRQRDLRYLSSMIVHLESSLGTRLGKIEQSLNAPGTSALSVVHQFNTNAQNAARSQHSLSRRAQ